MLNFCREEENFYQLFLKKYLFLADQPFWLIRQFEKKNTALSPSIQSQIGCRVTSIMVSQIGYTQSISFSNAVSLSQAHHTECLVAICCIKESLFTGFQVAFTVHQRHSLFIHHYYDFFVRYNLVILGQVAVHVTLGWTHSYSKIIHELRFSSMIYK